MKFVFIYSMLFFSAFSFANAVQCPDNTTILIGDFSYDGKKECDACVIYSCPGIIGGLGCVEDFYRDCSHEIDAIEFIKSKNESSLDFFNGDVLYMSGCGGEKDGTECLRKRSKVFHVEIVERIHNNNYKQGQIMWHNGAVGYQKRSLFESIGIILVYCIFVKWFYY